MRDPTQRETAKHAHNRADAVERALPTRRKDRLATRDVSEVREELGDAQHLHRPGRSDVIQPSLAPATNTTRRQRLWRILVFIT